MALLRRSIEWTPQAMFDAGPFGRMPKGSASTAQDVAETGTAPFTLGAVPMNRPKLYTEYEQLKPIEEIASYP